MEETTIHLVLNFTCSGPQAKVILYLSNRAGWKRMESFWALLCYINPVIRQPGGGANKTAVWDRIGPCSLSQSGIHFSIQQVEMKSSIGSKQGYLCLGKLWIRYVEKWHKGSLFFQLYFVTILTLLSEKGLCFRRERVSNLAKEDIYVSCWKDAKTT